MLTGSPIPLELRWIKCGLDGNSDKGTSQVGRIRSELTAFFFTKGHACVASTKVRVLVRCCFCWAEMIFFLRNSTFLFADHLKMVFPGPEQSRFLSSKPNYGVPLSHLSVFFSIKFQLFERYGWLRQRSCDYPMTLHSQRRCFECIKTIATHGPPYIYPTVLCHCAATHWARMQANSPNLKPTCNAFRLLQWAAFLGRRSLVDLYWKCKLLELDTDYHCSALL